MLEEYIVSYISSATTLVKGRRYPVAPMNSILAVAPVGRSLPETEKEVRNIPDGLFPHRTILRNNQATADRFLREIGQFDAIHFASHASMNRRYPLYSYLALADRKLELHELMSRSLSARLVVLSACDTGLGVGALTDIPSSEDMVSFPRAFLSAGASAVIASHWVADDDLTASLMTAFYHHLEAGCQMSTTPADRGRKSGCSLAQAFSMAERQVLAHSRVTGKKTNPFYWGGFYLIGDGR